ncbi:MAG: DUF5666 domain-containing protein [Burkholderiaceae bacterium]
MTNPFGGGLGGTGAPRLGAADPGGIGGTGAPQVSRADPGGIGGTGQVASGGGLGGTGIVGVVTGFSSICVNGLRVTYEPDAPVWRDGRHADPGELAVGQVVALQAARQGGGLRAQRIEVLDAVVGPVAAINAKTGHLALVGQIAQAQEPGDLAGMAVGDWVRVSGLTRADGVIRATRVQRAAPGLAWLRGRVTQLSGVAFRVGATRIDGRRLKWLADLSEGQEVVLKGQWNGQVFDAEAGTLEPTKALIQGSRAVVLEGYVQRVKGSEVDLDYARLTLSQRLRVAGGQQGDLRVGQKVQVHGRLGADAVVEVDHLQFLREVRRGDSANRRADAKTSQDDAEAGERDDSDDSASESSRGSTAVRTDDSGRGRGRGRGRGDNGGSGSSGSGSSGSGSSGSGSSGSGSSGSGSSGSGSSGSGSSGSGSSGSGSSGSGSSGGGDGGRGRGRGRGGR